MLHLFTKNKFVLTIGDEGAVLCLFKKGALQERMFAASPNSAEAEAIKELCAREKNVPLYVLVDVLDQSYVQQLIPPISALSINSLIKRRLEKDFAPTDIKGAMKLGRLEGGRKDWNYMFVSVHNVPPFSEWLDMALEVPNHFLGIYMLPIETELLLRELEQKRDSAPEKSSEWKILITHDRVSGVRQVIFRRFKLVLTRMNQPISNSAADVIAGNIEQDLLNTLEFVRRMGFDEKDGLDLFIIASSEVKEHLDIGKISANAISIFTPAEIASRLGLEKAAEATDKYGDVVLAAAFANRKKRILRLGTAYSASLEKLYALTTAFKALACILIAGAVIFSVYMIASYISLSSDMQEAEAKKSQAQEALQKVKREAADFPVEVSKLLNTLELKELLEKGKTETLDLIAKFSEAKAHNTLVKDINIRAADMDVDKNAPAKNAKKLTANFSVDIISPEKKVEQMLEIANSLVANINSVFSSDYDIKFGNLPGKETINAGIGNKTTADSTAVTVTLEDKPDIKKPVATAPEPQAKKP